MDKHFSESKHANLVEFCKASGLRRAEVTACRGTALVACSNSPVGLGISVTSGSKGGRPRVAPLYCNKQVAAQISAMCQAAGGGKIFEKIPGSADIHAYRQRYAERVYTANARPLHTLLQPEKYYCRLDKKGVVYDKHSLKIVSECLGHNRIGISASNYLHSVR